jgi:hypothetical protein
LVSRDIADPRVLDVHVIDKQRILRQLERVDVRGSRANAFQMEAIAAWLIA